MNNPLVSIIIPTFNRAHFIGETLDSVLAQTYTNWECIVVDDGSADASAEVLKSYYEKDSRIQYHHRPADRPKGANACRNFGFELSKGDYIQFLDSDDSLDFFCLSERISMVTKNLTINLLIRDTSLLLDNKRNNYSINEDPIIATKDEYLKMFLRYQIPWQTMGAFYKREILDSCRFDEDLDRFQDVSFNIKVLSQFSSLNILRDFKIDTCFRVDNDKLQLEGFMEKVFKSLVKFNKIHIDLIVNSEYRRNLQLFNYHFFTKYLILFFNNNKSASNFVLTSSIRSKLFNFKQKTALILLFIYINTGLIIKTGVGADRFRKYFNHSFLNQ